MTANVTPHLQGRSILLPGKLFKELKASGFSEVSSEGFFNGARKMSEHSFFDSNVELNEILDKLELELSDVQRQMVGWLSVVEQDLKEDPISYLIVWVNIADKDIYSFVLDLSETCKKFLYCIGLAQERGPKNWQVDFERHNQRIELLRMLAAEHYHLIRIFSERLAFAEHLSREDLESALPNASSVSLSKTYINIAYYLASVALAAGSIRTILGVT